jgi:hypothetical protein
VKLQRAWHKQDANQVMQTIGVTANGHVHLGYSLAGDQGDYFAEFEPDEALRFAAELAELAQYAKRLPADDQEDDFMADPHYDPDAAYAAGDDWPRDSRPEDVQ